MEITAKADSKKELEILKANNTEKPSDEGIKALRKLFNEKPEIWKELTDLAKSVQNNILNLNFSGSFLSKESYTRKLAFMRDNLGWQNSSELEKILIEQVCLNWLRLNLMESVHNERTYEKHSTETGLYWDKRLNSAQRRYLKACETLAKVRKLLADAELKEAQAQNKRSKGAVLANKLLKDLTS
jgi:hypothetical protein